MTWTVWLIQMGFSLICAVSVLHYFYLFFRRSTNFYILNYEERYISRLIKLTRIPYLITVFGSLWYMIFLASDRAMGWMPEDLFDAGDATAGGMFAMLGSCWAAIGLMSGMAHMSNRLVKLEQRIDLLKEHIEQITIDAKGE